MVKKIGKAEKIEKSRKEKIIRAIKILQDALWGVSPSKESSIKEAIDVLK